MKNQPKIDLGPKVALLDEAWVAKMIKIVNETPMSNEERRCYLFQIAKNAYIIEMWNYEKKMEIDAAVAKANEKFAKEAKVAAEKFAKEKKAAIAKATQEVIAAAEKEEKAAIAKAAIEAKAIVEKEAKAATVKREEKLLSNSKKP